MATRTRQKRRPAAGPRNPEPRPTGARAARYWAIAVAAAAVLVYLNVFGHAFVLDDTRLIRDNVRIRSLANVPHLFASSYWGVEGAQALYRPLALASYAVNYAVNGLSTDGYALVNVALHVGVSLLLFALLRALGGSAFAAGIAGLLFAVHPVHTEAVAGLTGRPELLAAFFGLLALLLHRRATAVPEPAVALRAAALASFACALLSKESAMTLLLVVPVMDAIGGRRLGAGEGGWGTRVLRDYLPFALVAAGYLAVRRAVLGGIVIAGSAIAALDNPLVPMTATPLGDRVGATAGQALMTAFALVTEYARLLAWPARLSPDYSYNAIPLVTSALDPRFLAGVLIAIACLIAIAVSWRKWPLAAFGLAFLVLTYSLISNIFVVIGTICAERLLYLPSAGAVVAVAVAADRCASASPSRGRIVAALAAVVMIAGAARTWIRNRDWTDEATLWTAAVAAAPASARVQTEYARILMTRAEGEAAAGRASEAERLYADARSHFEAATGIYPSYSLALDGLAMIDSLHDRFAEADALYARALRAWPGNFASLTNWASLKWEQSRRIGARATELRQAGRIAEADVLVRQADAGFQQAVDKIGQATAMMPSYAQAHLVRAMILESYVGDRQGAIAEFETVLRLEPNHPQRTLIESEMQRLRGR